MLTRIKARSHLVVLVFLCLALVRPAAYGLQAHLSVSHTGTNFVYTASNDEPTNSTLSLCAVHLGASGPFDVVASPPGWVYLTDHNSYVDWSCAATNVPSTNDIPPGGSLSGFVLQSRLPTSDTLDYALISWDNGVTNTGPTFSGWVESPSTDDLSPVISSFHLGSPNAPQFDLMGVPTYFYGIQVSTNLTDWVMLFTNSCPFTFVDVKTNPIPQAFYRAFLPSGDD